MPAYIITCKEDATDEQVQSAKQHAKDQGGEITHEYSLIKGFAVKFPEDSVSTLERHPHIHTVEHDGEMKTHSPGNRAAPTVDKQVSVSAFEASLETGDIASDRSVQDAYNAPSTTGDNHPESPASIQDGLSQVLKAVEAAAFDSLDSAVIAYYQRSSKGNEWLRQEQRLNRMRRLPVLLKELHLAAQGWGQWERRNFQEQIIKSTEDILFAELQDHLATRRSSPHGSPCSMEQRGQAHQHMMEHDTDPEAEVSLQEASNAPYRTSIMLTTSTASQYMDLTHISFDKVQHDSFSRLTN
ncbi:hypothetical protein HYE67_009787 [Fusarium culmorum]|uniref:Inhibitor I9 domain-containing protein n=1 Tax=Fusarium culmorum TaxID=5516 RepID=A0A7S8HZM4_FUSCU|nr:hypothetical protein HYE67_009787 [Fusarium culmorum]